MIDDVVVRQALAPTQELLPHPALVLRPLGELILVTFAAGIPDEETEKVFDLPQRIAFDVKKYFRLARRQFDGRAEEMLLFGQRLGLDDEARQQIRRKAGVIIGVIVRLHLQGVGHGADAALAQGRERLFAHIIKLGDVIGALGQAAAFREPR